MRANFALTILLLGLGTAAAEPDHQAPTGALEGTSAAVSLTSEPSIGKSDRAAVPSAPTERSSEAMRGQDKEPAAPPPLAATARAATESEAPAASSIGGLCNAVFTSAEDNDLPVPFFANLIWQESRLRHDAVSPVGALGIAQFMPRVAAAVGLVDPFDPQQALPASARLLRSLREHFGNLGFVAAAYNAGARRVSEWLEHRGRLPRETLTYVVRVTGRSIEQWRKRPSDDVTLTFARPLPCRELPAFADLEQEQTRQAQSQQAKVAQQAAEATRFVAVSHRHAHRRLARRETVRMIRTAARSLRGGRHEATRRHLLHERRRIALGESFMT